MRRRPHPPRRPVTAGWQRFARYLHHQRLADLWRRYGGAHD